MSNWDLVFLAGEREDEPCDRTEWVFTDPDEAENRAILKAIQSEVPSAPDEVTLRLQEKF